VWGHARRVALARAGYACEECGISDWEQNLDVHHIVPVDPIAGYRPGPQHRQENLAVLCQAHHRAIHRALRTPVGQQLVLGLAA
jgi:5-methylcytosine-specific restriction endonuclease McrA